jgi:hypothetical protein
MYLCFRNVDFACVSMIFLLTFRTVTTVWYFFSFHFLYIFRNEELQTYLFESTKELLQPYLTPDIMRELELTPTITKSEH